MRGLGALVDMSSSVRCSVTAGTEPWLNARRARGDSTEFIGGTGGSSLSNLSLLLLLLRTSNSRLGVTRGRMLVLGDREVNDYKV
jgi:hypothetical protein